MLQGDRGLSHQWQHQNLISHPFSQQSPLHIMRQEMKSICSERPTLILYVWRPTETGVTESNLPTVGGEDTGVIRFLQRSNSLFSSRLLIAIPKVTAVAKSLYCIYVFRHKD